MRVKGFSYDTQKMQKGGWKGSLPRDEFDSAME